jgi:hypothetical protein
MNTGRRGGVWIGLKGGGGGSIIERMWRQKADLKLQCIKLCMDIIHVHTNALQPSVKVQCISVEEFLWISER